MTDGAAAANDLFASHPDALDFQPGHRVQPLIGGQQTYKALEEAISEARQSVHMAYWTLDPTTRTTGDVGVDTLGELLRDVVKRGVDLRIVVADFDPVIATMYHVTAWRAYRQLIELVSSAAPDYQDHFAIMCSRHDTRWGPVGRTAAQPILRYKLAEKVAALNALPTAKERRQRLSELPGLWPFVSFSNGKAAAKPLIYPGFYPAAHHEKLCVIDDRLVFLGGLDITEKRRDDWDHDNEYPWHDVACRLEGPAATFFARHFRSRWNEEREEFHAFLQWVEPPKGIDPLPVQPETPILPTDIEPAEPIAGGVEVKPLRTLSKQSRSWFSRSPRTVISEIKDCYLDLICQARDFIYIENQYLRSTTIAEALAARAKAAKDLELILVLPLMAEDAFVEEEPNIATRHGQYLQEKNTDILRDAFGDRLGIFAMLMPGEERLPDPEEADPKDIIESTVYIHAKTMICDDKVAIIGSANLNDRSLVTDTETAIVWRGQASVRPYRLALWEHALDLKTDDWKTDHLARWKQIAIANVRGDPDARSGFIVPFPRRHLDAHARKSWLVPDELV
jgi:phosphatidylserine/phosphatidylglycerophosphate/cardiolipin synthase-like enzyme